MMNSRMMCRSSATLGIEPAPRYQSTGSVWVPDEDVPQLKSSRAPGVVSGATLALVTDERQVENPELPIIRVARRTYWFNGPIAKLPKREPYISPTLIPRAAEDE